MAESFCSVFFKTDDTARRFFVQGVAFLWFTHTVLAPCFCGAMLRGIREAWPPGRKAGARLQQSKGERALLWADVECVKRAVFRCRFRRPEILPSLRGSLSDRGNLFCPGHLNTGDCRVDGASSRRKFGAP